MDKISINNLRVCYGKGRKKIEVLHGITLSAEVGKVTAIIGESGSGKTTIAKALQGILNDNASVEGSITIQDQEYILEEIW